MKLQKYKILPEWATGLLNYEFEVQRSGIINQKIEF